MKITMISKNKKFVFIAFWKVLSGFKYFNNSQNLIIMSFISSFNILINKVINAMNLS